MNADDSEIIDGNNDNIIENNLFVYCLNNPINMYDSDGYFAFAIAGGGAWAFGGANFLQEYIENLLETASIKPMVNKVLCHISNTPLSLIDYCQSKGIAVETYSPVAHGEAMKNIKIKELADKYGVTVPQLCIRYDIQLGAIVIPKTANPDHMRTNAELDFVISDADMETLKAIPQINDYGEYSRFSVFGGKK